MSAFEDEFEIPAMSEVDPAAEFLAKEQEELGDIGADLGLGAGSAVAADTAQDAFGGGDDFSAAAAPAAVPQDVLGGGDGDVNPFMAQEPAQDIASSDGKDIYAGMQTLSIKKDQEEPEFMRKWREEQQERLRKKDEDETAAMEELKQKAQQELVDWYKRYESQVEQTRSSNREEEGQHENTEMNHIEPGTEWERVAKHCDFSTKAPGHTKDVSRMRAIMLQLKQNQTVKA